MSAPETPRPVDLDAPGPRTYQASFAMDAEGRPTLLTAEEWLREEADIWSAMAFDDDTSDEPNRAGTLRAIAREVETIRRERSQWAASHTALTTQLRELEAANARLTADAARWAFVRDRVLRVSDYSLGRTRLAATAEWLFPAGEYLTETEAIDRIRAIDAARVALATEAPAHAE